MAKIKIKTNKSASKRFTKTGSGSVKYRKANSNHILTKKTAKRKRQLKKYELISKANKKTIKLLLPNG